MAPTATEMRFSRSTVVDCHRVIGGPQVISHAFGADDERSQPFVRAGDPGYTVCVPLNLSYRIYGQSVLKAVRLGQKLTGTSVYKALNALAATTTLAIALAVGSASATAQDAPDARAADPTVRTADPTVRTTVDTVDREPDFNWGWLGLAGLAGLLGLMPRDRQTVTMRDGAGNAKDTLRR